MKTLKTNKMITATALGCDSAPINTKLAKDTFALSAFIRRSQRADLVYLKKLRDGKYAELGCEQIRRSVSPQSLNTAGASSSPFSTLCNPRPTEKIAKITNEYNTSKPKDALEAETVCDRDGEVYWESLNQCMADEVVAVADYTGGDGKMYFRDGTSINPTVFEQPLATGKYIEYSTGELLSRLGSFAGKKISIEWDGAIPSTGQRTLFSFKASSPYVVVRKINGTWDCAYIPTCPTSATNPTATVYENLPLPSSIDKFRIGNTFTTNYPLGINIKKITIRE